MSDVGVAPNRTLDLGELDRPDYRTVLERMEALLAAVPAACGTTTVTRTRPSE